MLIRNSNISCRQASNLKGRKIDNTVNLHITTGTHGYSQDKQKYSLDFQQPCQIMDLKKPSKSINTKNKENIDTNLPTKRLMVKTQSVKSISKIKKSSTLVKSIIAPNKKGDSARSSLSKRSKSQANLIPKKHQEPNRKSLSPKASTLAINKLMKPLLSQRQIKTTRGKQTQREKKKDFPTNILKNQPKKKKKVVVDPNILLNDESIDIARELQNMHKNQMKNKKPSKKTLQKHDKKVIISSNISKHRPLDSQRDSPDIAILTQKYKIPKKMTNTSNNTIKPKAKECNLPISYKSRKEGFAAIVIQRAFRQYLDRKNIRKIIESIITIQRWWRQHLRIKHSSELPILVGQQSLVTVQDFSYDSDQKKNKRLKINTVEQSSDEIIKERVKYLLEEEQSKLDSQKYSATKKISFSPLKDRSQINMPLKMKSPKQNIQSWNIVQNLPNLQKLHKQKLIKNFNSQKQAIVKLWEEKLCSPRTQQGKLRELDDRLNKQLARFEAGVKEVLRGWSLTKQEPLSLETEQEFDQDLSNQSEQLELNKRQNKSSFGISYNLSNSDARNQIKQISDISIQLSGIHQVLQQKDGKQLVSLKFDSSLQGIQKYLTGLYSYLEGAPGWKEQFFDAMNRPRGISIFTMLSNLDYIQQENVNTFKLPRYKAYTDQNYVIVKSQMIEKYNKQYVKLRRLSDASESHKVSENTDELGEYQYFHIQAAVDALNQQLHRQKPKNSLNFQVPKNRFQSRDQSIVQMSFAAAWDQIIKSGSCLCGFIDDNNDIEEGYLVKIQETRLRQMLSGQMKVAFQDQKMQQQMIETKVSLAQQVFLDVFHQAMYQFWKMISK